MKKLFFKNQEVTPLDHNSVHAGKIFHVSEYKWRRGNWYIQVIEIPPSVQPDGSTLIEWYNQLSVGPVMPELILNELLMDVYMTKWSDHNDLPFIICPDKVGGLGI